MNICFTETETESQEFLARHLSDHKLSFVSDLESVPPEVEVLSIFINTRIDRALLAAHPRLRFIATRSTGLDHIDLEACAERQVTVSFVPNYGENTVAEHTFALLLAVSRRLRQAMSAKRDGKFSFEELRGFDLKGKTIGVVGAGRIGLHVIRIAKAFGMEVIATDISRTDTLSEVLGFEYVSFDELLERSDIISLHVPLTPVTVHLLNRETFAKCRRGIVVINTSRGGLIETDALLEALRSGAVIGAGLDVLEDERLFRSQAPRLMTEEIVKHLQQISSPEELHLRHPERLAEIQQLSANEALLAQPNVIFTPHIAFNSVEAVERINQVTVENILAFARGEPVNVVPL
ncbi:MAG: hydroxyacid dehydrogenase [Chthoniobacterales bacterium]|nr:MAG: hydroxyacid dehydrogenase [Chthoniobacterales bacterium]